MVCAFYVYKNAPIVHRIVFGSLSLLCLIIVDSVYILFTVFFFGGFSFLHLNTERIQVAEIKQQSNTTTTNTTTQRNFECTHSVRLFI